MRTTGKMRVLLADGHTEIRKAVREYVTRLPGFEVVGEVADGIKAVEEVDRLKPDVVLLDFELARRNGLEATRIIKERSGDTMVFVSTLFDDPFYREKAQQANVDGIIVKASLMDSLNSVFGGVVRRQVGGNTRGWIGKHSSKK